MFEEFFKAEGIDFYAVLDAKELTITDRKKFERMEEEIGPILSAVIFLIPYYSGQKTTNLSIYAQPRDYHYYVRLLSERLDSYLKEKTIKIGYRLFSDTSPIAERAAALRAGLGILGNNGLVLNERYGSYFFIGEIFVTEPIPAPRLEAPLSRCEACGACEKVCPTGAIRDPERKMCLSLISQKKNLSEREKALLDAASCKWGCDLCQTVCPYNKNAAHTPIPFFREQLVTRLDEDTVEEEKAKFQARAYSWRGRNILRRNLGWKQEK